MKILSNKTNYAIGIKNCRHKQFTAQGKIPAQILSQKKKADFQR